MKLSFATNPSMVGAMSLVPSFTVQEEVRAVLLRQGYRDLLSDARDGLVFRSAPDRDASTSKGIPS